MIKTIHLVALLQVIVGEKIFCMTELFVTEKYVATILSQDGSYFSNIPFPQSMRQSIANTKRIIYDYTVFSILSEQASAGEAIEAANFSARSGLPIDKVTRYGQTLLHEAAAQGDAKLTAFLIDIGMQKDQVDTYGQTPLFLAILGGHGQVVALLLNSGADCKRRNNRYLHLAASKGHRDIVELLIRADADKDALFVDVDDGRAPLHVAVCRGDAALVDLLLQAGAKPGVRTSEGKTALFLAVEHASTNPHAVEVVRLLLRAGAIPEERVRIRSFSPFTPQDHFHQRVSLNLSSPRGDRVMPEAPRPSARYLTPLDRANELGHAEIVSLLVTACAARERNSLALLIAAKEGDAQTILTLLQQGADIEKSTADRETALFLAAQNGRVNAVCVLLGAGANKNKAASNGSTPLYSAALNGYARVVYQLIKAGADTDMPASNGKTPLFMASRHGHAEVVELLMNAGASL